MRQSKDIIEEFVNACIKNGDALEEGDAKTANKQHRIIEKIRKELKSDKGYGLSKLVPLLGHINDTVKLKTAYSIIPIEPEKARDVLTKLSEQRGTVSFTAYMVLEEWNKGNLS